MLTVREPLLGEIMKFWFTILPMGSNAGALL
jgi:hypothetical protein